MRDGEKITIRPDCDPMEKNRTRFSDSVKMSINSDGRLAAFKSPAAVYTTAQLDDF